MRAEEEEGGRRKSEGWAAFLIIKPTSGTEEGRESPYLLFLPGDSGPCHCKI